MKKYIIVFLLSFLVLGCKKYLDITPTGQIVVETTDDFYNLVSYPGRGYPTNNFQYLVDDQWIKENAVIGMAKNIDIINVTFDTSVSRVDYLGSSTLYNRAYTYINRWNMIVTLVDESTGDESIKKIAKAEAKVLRAYDHFILVNTFAKVYNPATAATDGGICIMDKYDLEAKPVKSTVAAVYDFIEKDLDEAIPYLQEKPKDVYHPSLAFAWAFKAKLLLFKRDYEKAKAAALQALTYNNSLFDMVAYSKQGGPSVLATPAGSNPETLSYMYMSSYSEMNIGYSYKISGELKNLFGSHDARYNLFFDSTNKTYLDIGAHSAYWKVKYTAFFYPTVGIQVPEVYLTLAECYARTGDLSAAMEIVNNLRSKRITDATEAHLETPATAVEVVKYIISERRKELLFGFNRFWDLKRYNTEPEYAKTITRTFPLVSTSVPHVTYTLPPDSRLYVIPFAQDVLKKNPNLTINTNETLPW
ncbi:RagB/SusD family nutrient uptake outer membrane protein [Chitinophaga sancti]|uniref:RagB/SusD family nutrient uptake outer membrane protein n=1 Tax=Chitinophaga sancti TaxID=1004 RepID=A0A1K1MKQ2_9BACT|nr:RagB/SusD family nutrient uptake outer membrane protein [Chitinophaga sancti]WQD62766.1 RagB/SusD family nutrient uptake outer membrane protein [Chitinophaga sancti]WQG91610.1 RagB/SusD family nutrient uptake outer membrane protein [Chitinophaga sancti]SFW23643.1 SusD family protein [Chitinophaga sancti]